MSSVNRPRHPAPSPRCQAALAKSFAGNKKFILVDGVLTLRKPAAKQDTRQSNRPMITKKPPALVVNKVRAPPSTTLAPFSGQPLSACLPSEVSLSSTGSETEKDIDVESVFSDAEIVVRYWIPEDSEDDDDLIAIELDNAVAGASERKATAIAGPDDSVNTESDDLAGGLPEALDRAGHGPSCLVPGSLPCAICQVSRWVTAVGGFSESVEQPPEDLSRHWHRQALFNAQARVQEYATWLSGALVSALAWFF
ncbi:hypothetical protein TWF694_000189 [Orbilia ellipsospora]|uniref:Uncharacterized protein n=1 Tax=Orbilia ellipsospora TaxID=2528407 RepID=A0AAV9XR92_9PEZI